MKEMETIISDFNAIQYTAICSLTNSNRLPFNTIESASLNDE